MIGIQEYLLFFGLVSEQAQLHFPKLLLSYFDLSLKLGLPGSKWPLVAPRLIYLSKVLIIISLPFRILMQAFFKIEQFSRNLSSNDRLQHSFGPYLLEPHTFCINVLILPLIFEIEGFVGKTGGDGRSGVGSLHVGGRGLPGWAVEEVFAFIGFHLTNLLYE